MSTLIEETAKSRAELGIALQNGADVLEATMDVLVQNESLIDLTVTEDKSDDMLLVFNEHHPNGIVVPLSWEYHMAKSCTEPMTCVRVSREMARAVMEVL